MNGMHNHRHDRAPLSLYKSVTNAQSSIRDHTKQRSQKIPKTAVQHPLRCLDRPMLRRGGGGLYRIGKMATQNCNPFPPFATPCFTRCWGDLRDPPTQSFGTPRDPEMSTPTAGGGRGALGPHPPTPPLTHPGAERGTFYCFRQGTLPSRGGTSTPATEFCKLPSAIEQQVK